MLPYHAGSSLFLRKWNQLGALVLLLLLPLSLLLPPPPPPCLKEAAIDLADN